MLTKGKNAGYPRRAASEHQTAPEAPLEVPAVQIALVDNAALEGVAAATPAVDVGAHVEVGECIARVDDTTISVPCHASITGRVAEVTPSQIRIEA